MNLRFMLIWVTWFAVTAALVAASHRQRGAMKFDNWLILWQQTFTILGLVCICYGLYQTTRGKRAHSSPPSANGGPGIVTIDCPNGISIRGKMPYELKEISPEGFIFYGPVEPPERSRDE